MACDNNSTLSGAAMRLFQYFMLNIVSSDTNGSFAVEIQLVTLLCQNRNTDNLLSGSESFSREVRHR